jgi:hypothetical protein
MNTEIIPLNIPRSLAATEATVFLPNTKAAEPFFGFFTSNIRNRNMRRAYYKAACHFAEWCEGGGLRALAGAKPLHEALCHHKLEVFLDEYIAAAGFEKDAPLFRTTGRATGTAHRMTQSDAYRMIELQGRAPGSKPRSVITRAARPELPTTSRALARSNTPKRWPTIHRHAPRGCTNRRADEVSLDEYERVGI